MTATNRWSYPVARPTSNSGFTLVEACAALVIIGMFTLFAIPAAELNPDSWYSYPDEYLKTQSEAIRMAERRTMISPDGELPDVTFNEKGNVNRAMTLRSLRHGTSVIIELGGGRLVFR